MAISGLNQAGFNAMVDFVQQSYDQLALDTLGSDSVSPEKADQFTSKKDELVKQLDGSIREAAQSKQKPVEQLLKDMRGTVKTAMPDSPPNPGVIQQFERQGEKARKEQDVFGAKDGQFQLPAVFNEALGFLKTVFGEKPVAPKSEAKPPAATPKADVATPRAEAQPRTEADPRVARFVASYFGDSFDGPAKTPTTQKQFAAALPKAEREAFEKLPKAEKDFVLSLSEKQRPAYAAMPKEEQAFFRSMKPSERGQFTAMTPDERKYFKDLNPDQRAAYVALHPDQRQMIREQGAEGRKALLAPQTEALKQFENKPATEVARTVSSDALKMLGFKPPAEGQDTKGQAGALMEKTQGLMMNFLQAQPGNVAAARVQTLKALLNTPELQQALMTDLEQRLVTVDQKKGNRPSESYAEHFKKIRPIVMQHAEKLLRPDIDRDGLLAGLEKAVEVSAEFAAAHPPRKRDLKASKNLKFRVISG